MESFYAVQVGPYHYISSENGKREVRYGSVMVVADRFSTLNEAIECAKRWDAAVIYVQNFPEEDRTDTVEVWR